MIGSLRGELLERWPSELLVEVNGIGYRVTTTPTTAVEVADVGQPVFIYTHHVLREDASTLYGFVTNDERACFEALLGAHGVGPSLALAILGVHPPSSLRRVLADSDVNALCLVPGVGKKTAARLLVELSSRLDVPLDDAAVVEVAGSINTKPTVGASARADVRDALVSLGYGPDEVLAVLRELPDEGDASELLRVALSRLAVR